MQGWNDNTINFREMFFNVLLYIDGVFMKTNDFAIGLET
jgi:hypothetical protein